MGTLRLLRHGPLVFWLVALLALSSAFAVALRSDQEPIPALAASTAWADVESWRASLTQLPLLAAGGEVVDFARSLQSVAVANAESARAAGFVDLAAAWMYAAQASDRLARAAPRGQSSLQAAIRELGLAGDRLLLVASGGKWIEASLPSELDLVAPIVEGVNDVGAVVVEDDGRLRE